MNLRLLLLLPLISATAMTGETHAATRIALAGAGNGVEDVLDAATALLSKDTGLQLLDRAEVGRVLREQEISLAGLVRAEHAVKAGQLLHVDLFAVLEGGLTNETQVPTAFGLVVFDAKNGVRYADSALVASNAVSAASATAVAIRTAVTKAHRNPQDLHTVGLLRVRNADLPRQFDSLCDSVGLLLERELTVSPGIAVLERRRLEQVNKERSLPTDTEGNRLLSSLRMIELDIGQDSAGLRGTLALVGADGARTKGITASVPTRNPATLAHLLVDKIERFLKVPVDDISLHRKAEAGRFHREYLLLVQHRDYDGAVHALDAATALAPEEESWRREMVLLLPDAAIEIVDPGGQNWARPLPAQPSSEALAKCLALSLRGADLLVDISRPAVDQASRGAPIPPVVWWNSDYRGAMFGFLGKLAMVESPEPARIAEVAELAAKDRILRMEIMEPYLFKRTMDLNGLANYSRHLSSWLGSDCNLYHSPLLAEERRRDDRLALSRWVEVSHKVNPPDGSGDYGPVQSVFSGFLWHQVAELMRTLEEDRDPLIRLYAHASRMTATIKTNNNSSKKLEGVSKFRLYAQDLLAHSETPKPSPFRNRVWETIKTTLSLLLNEDQGWKESLEACRFAIAQGEIQPELFLTALVVLDDKRHRKVREAVEVANGALKLVLEGTNAYPSGFFLDRNGFIKRLEQTRDQLAGELTGTKTNANIPPSSPWKRSVCLLDLAKPIDGLAWLFKPVVQDGQVFTVALGLHEWGSAEDRLQLIRVPLRGGHPVFLGRANPGDIKWGNRRYVIPSGPDIRLKEPRSLWLDVVRAACVGGGCYHAATVSGIFIFPTNGGPVLHLGTTNGLPTDDINAIAFLDGKLYFGAGEEHEGYFASYDSATRKVNILGSSRRSEHLSPFDDQPPFYTIGIVADTSRHRLLMSVSSAIIPTTTLPAVSSCMGIWSYSPSTGEYKRLAPFRLCNLPRWLMHRENWAGLVNETVLATKEKRTLNLFDLVNDRLLSVYDPLAAPSPWQKFQPELGCPWGVIPVDGPFALRDGWFYSARPFARMALADGRREELPPARTDYPFEIKESLQLLDDGKNLLLADQYSIWLLELGPEPTRASDQFTNTAAKLDHVKAGVEQTSSKKGADGFEIPRKILAALDDTVSASVIHLAQQTAEKGGRNLSEYSAPVAQPLTNRQDWTWVVRFNGKTRARGDYFDVWVNAQTGKTELTPGE